MKKASQYNYPDWERFEEMAKGIFEREYYTNHGPLAQKFENRIADKLNVKHAVCMSNMGIGLMIAVKALDLDGKILVPDFGENVIYQSLIWAGLKPVYVKVDESTHFNISNVNDNDLKEAKGMLVINNFGNSPNIKAIEDYASDNNLKLAFVSSDVIGQTYGGVNFGAFGDMEIFSLHEKFLINAIDASVITTNDDNLAARLRNIRSSYGAGVKVSIPFTGNGRLSEAQAGMGLLSMDDIENNIGHNKSKYLRLVETLQKSNDFSFLPTNSEVSNENYQKLVVKLSADSALSKKQILARLGIEDSLLRYSFNPLGKEKISDRNDCFVSNLIEFPLDDSLYSDVERVIIN